MNMHNLKVLVADDFDNARKSLKKMLFTLGVDSTDLASNGKEVVNACKNTQYDVILCDYNLGQGKNGQQVLEEVRVKRYLKSTALFVIISAETSRDMVMGAMESRPDEYLTKPFTQGVLKKRLERALAQSESLSPIYQAIAKKDSQKVLELCLAHIQENGRYKAWCRKTQMKILLDTKRLDKAEVLCRQVLEERDLDWAYLAEAKISLGRKNYAKAVAQLETLIARFPQCMEAYDLLASSLQKAGNSEKAQKTLEMAVHISPRTLGRQEVLTKVCILNNDLETAVKASHQTLKLSLHSIHESPAQYFQLASLLAEAAADDDSSEGKRKAQEAFATLNQVTKKYSGQAEVDMKKALVESRVFASQGEKNKAQQCLALAQTMCDQNPALLTPETALEMGKSFYAAGKEFEAEALLMKLVKENKDKHALVAEINTFMDEPVSNAKKAQAKKINGEGLILYKQQQYQPALDKFEEALTYSPKHPGLNMNLIQSALKLIEDKGKDAPLLEKCLNAIGRIRHITDQHKQYQRYQSLKQHVARYE